MQTNELMLMAALQVKSSVDQMVQVLHVAENQNPKYAKVAEGFKKAQAEIAESVKLLKE
jgi:ATP-dependent 26S proteasome regulatory subunit